MDDDPGIPGRLDELQKTGGSIVGRLGCGALIFVCLVGSPFFWSTAKLDYTIKAQVSEGTLVAMEFQGKVEEYYQLHGTWPIDNEAAGIPVDGTIDSNYVSRVEVDNGAIIMVFGKSAESEIIDRTIVLAPEYSANLEATWTCHSTDIPDKRLPGQCQAR